MARVHGASDRVAVALADWEMTFVPPAKGTASARDVDAATWMPAIVPGTAASAWRATHGASFDGIPAFDRHDVWYRARVVVDAAQGALVLRMGGLATLAEVWWGEELVLESKNAFHAHEVELGERPPGEHVLTMRFRSVHAELGVRRPRPRWKTRLVDNQQLRWIRTPLPGRIPPWTPPVPGVGPFRAVALERRPALQKLEPSFTSRLEGGTGVVAGAVRLRSTAKIDRVTLVVGGVETPLALALDGMDAVASGEARLPDVDVWWPHTHGAQPLHDVRLDVVAGGQSVTVPLGKTGFRALERVPSPSFGVIVNGVRVFCRGACWTPLDVASLGATREAYRAALVTARDGGMNMIRVGGTMLYEDNAFYELCDELGILVFQDFMFANMDYPVEDEAFRASVKREAEELVRRTALSPSLAVWCGGSEVEQQAAMVGVPRELWTSALFAELLPGILAQERPGAIYVCSTPTGGALPFHVDSGVAHYFGVGAYLRPLEDARRAGVKFAAECLAFANVPCDSAIEELLGDGQAAPHHPLWKARVPRDAGPGWDFDDVRDHYVRELFHVDPAKIRYADVQRYLALGRVAVGEAMARTYEEFRRAGSECNGALVWFYRDLWNGAGWGVVDAAGRPKASYYYLKRVFAPVLLLATDEGMNGVELSAVNDTAHPVDGTVEILLIRDGSAIIAHQTAPALVPARGKWSIRVDEILPHFLDTTYAYRFGPPGYQALAAVLRDRETQRELAGAHFFPGGFDDARQDVGLEATAVTCADGAVDVTLAARNFARAVALDAAGFVAEDSYFHLRPSAPRTVTLRPIKSGARFDGWATPLNALLPTRIRLG